VKLPAVVVTKLKLSVAIEADDAASPVKAVCVGVEDDKAIVCVPAQRDVAYVLTMLNFVVKSIAVKVEPFKIVRDSIADEMRVAVSSHNSTLTPRILVIGVAPYDSVSALR
jgi:hypothetical protein